MKRESLLSLRTSREVLTSLDMTRVRQSAPTMLKKMRFLIARGTKEVAPHPNEIALAVELEKERRQFKRRLQVVERSIGKVLGFRRRLAATQEKNRRIMDLRLQLQRQYWKETSPLAPGPGHSGASTRTEDPRQGQKRWRVQGREVR